MSNTVDKHTPGPWVANSGMIYAENHGATIAVFYTNGGNLQPISEEEKEANMFLCAEAPTLKKENEELKERNRVLVEALQQILKEKKEPGMSQPYIDKILSIANKALQSNLNSI